MILVPILISLFIQNFSDTGSEGNMKVLTVHTDLNCKTEKYKYSSEELVYKYLDAIKNELSPDIDLVVWPETAITNLDRINTLNQNNMPMTSVLGSNKKTLDAGSVNTNVLDSNTSMSTPLLLSPDAEKYIEREKERYLPSRVLYTSICPVTLSCVQSLIVSC